MLHLSNICNKGLSKDCLNCSEHFGWANKLNGIYFYIELYIYTYIPKLYTCIDDVYTYVYIWVLWQECVKKNIYIFQFQFFLLFFFCWNLLFAFFVFTFYLCNYRFKILMFVNKWVEKWLQTFFALARCTYVFFYRWYMYIHTSVCIRATNF